MTHLWIQRALALSAIAVASQAAAQITFYEGEGFRGRSFSTSAQVANFERTGFNDRSSSVVVERGRWEVCSDARYAGRCVVLRQGSYDSLQKLGLENVISSARPAGKRRRQGEEEQAQLAEPNYPWRQRADERTYEAPVTAVHAVMGPPTQRCWMERQQVGDNGGQRAGATIVGALIGGVLGHQVGGGTGKDLATVGGAVAGGVIGNTMAGSGGVETRNVQRCESSVQGPPAYWDVNYTFRGREHAVQMTAAPGATVLVNARGEPRQ